MWNNRNSSSAPTRHACGAVTVCAVASLVQCSPERIVDHSIEPDEPDEPERVEARADIAGALSRDEVRDTVRDGIEEIRGCYNRALDKSPNINGTVTVAARITATGHVESSTIADSSVDNPSLEACIVDRFSTWQFPKAGAATEVSYPFALSVH